MRFSGSQRGTDSSWQDPVEVRGASVATVASVARCASCSRTPPTSIRSRPICRRTARAPPGPAVGRARDGGQRRRRHRGRRGVGRARAARPTRRCSGPSGPSPTSSWSAPARVRAEGYGPVALLRRGPRPPAAAGGQRRPPPRLAIVTGSLDLDLGQRRVRHRGAPTPGAAPSTDADDDRRGGRGGVADVVAGRRRTRRSRRRRSADSATTVAVVVVEGGPTLNGALSTPTWSTRCASPSPRRSSAATATGSSPAPTPATRRSPWRRCWWPTTCSSAAGSGPDDRSTAGTPGVGSSGTAPERPLAPGSGRR